MSANIMGFLPSFMLLFTVFIYVAIIGGIIVYFVKLYKVHVRIDQKLALLMEKLDHKEQ
jgi:hypothetical protein